MHLELQRLLKDDPGLESRLAHLPGRLFSGREHPQPGGRAVFFCYSLPVRKLGEDPDASDLNDWSIDAGITQWYLF